MMTIWNVLVVAVVTHASVRGLPESWGSWRSHVGPGILGQDLFFFLLQATCGDSDNDKDFYDSSKSMGGTLVASVYL